MLQSITQNINVGVPAPVYLIQSEDELLAKEARDPLLRFLTSVGFTDRKLFTQTSLKWHELLVDLSSPSMFSEQCVYDIRLPEAKIGREGAGMINQLLELASAEQVLIFSLPVDWAVQKLAWVKKIDSMAVGDTLKVPTANEWKAWLSARLKKANVLMSADALQMFSEWVDGHLLAADQEIQKLAFLHDGKTNKTLDVAALRQSMVNMSHYGAFDFRQAFLARDWNRALRMIDRLENEGESAILICRLLSEDLRKAMRIYGHQKNNKSEFEAQRAEAVFYDRARALSAFIKNVEVGKVYQLLLGSEIMDLSAKNAFDESPWMLFRRIVNYLRPESSKSYAIDWSSYIR